MNMQSQDTSNGTDTMESSSRPSYSNPYPLRLYHPVPSMNMQSQYPPNAGTNVTVPSNGFRIQIPNLSKFITQFRP
jgi:hypothetical protein